MSDRVRQYSLALLLAGTLGIAASSAGQEQKKNPFEASPDVIAEGKSIFRLQCAGCHGIDARGGRGPDLSAGRWLHGSSDEAVFRTITKGVPGTQMPPGDFSDNEVWMLISYLRSLATSPGIAITGNRDAGEKIFFGEGMCAQCHMVNGRGGRLGPELSRIGAARAPRFLIESIRDPGKEITPGYETVTAVTKNGWQITGARRNEDAFSVQLLDLQQQLQMFLKKDLKDVVYEKRSLMPALDDRVLNQARLNDLIAYLDSLRGRP